MLQNTFMLKKSIYKKLYMNVDNTRLKMILLFGEKAQNSQTANKNTGIKNHNNPVENSGILAMNGETALNFLNASEYDDFIASNPVAVNYEAYSEWSESIDSGFMNGFASAVATLESAYNGGGFFDGGFAGACADCGGSFGGGGGFSSVC